MDIKRTYEIVQNAVAQAMGKEYMEKLGELSSLDSSKLADLGRDMDEAGSLDSYMKGLISQLSAIEIEARLYNGDLKGIMVKDYEWGGFIERVTFDLSQIIDDPKWNLAANYNANPNFDYGTIDHKFYKPSVTAKAFIEAKPLMIPASKPSDQLKESFNGWSQMTSFLSGLQEAINTTMEAAVTSYRHMLVQNAIAVTTGNKLNSGNGTAVYLLDLLDEAGITQPTDTPEMAINNAEALAFCMQVIAEDRDNMKVMTKAFSDGSSIAFTPSDYSRLILLNKFEKACKFRVKANTFNKDDIGIGDYDTTTAWQGIVSQGDRRAFSFKNVSTVSIAKNEEDVNDKLGVGLDKANFEAKYCVGLLYDYKAIGICPFKKKTTGNYIASGDFFNEFYHLLLNLLLDTRYNMVSYFLARKADAITKKK